MNKTIKCPYCNSENIAKYLFGEIAFDEKINKQIENKEIILGGCCIMPSSPAYKCNICGKDFGKYKELNK